MAVPNLPDHSKPASGTAAPDEANRLPSEESPRSVLLPDSGPATSLAAEVDTIADAIVDAIAEVEPPAPITFGTRLLGHAHLALGLVRAVPGELAGEAAVPYVDVDEQARDVLFRELHRYPRKKMLWAWLAWAIGGVVGAHRYYLGQVGLGVLMTCTLGGCFVWWIVDAFSLTRLVDDFNTEQEARARTGAPPIGMEFVPTTSPDALAARPNWADQMRRPTLSLFGDALVLTICAAILGSLAGEAGTYNALWATISVIVLVNVAEYLMPWHHLPGIRQMLRWDYKLRLFYQFNAPGRALKLFFRPWVGIFVAPFSRRARAEVRLYLEIAGLFAALNILLALFGDGALLDNVRNLAFSELLGNWLKGLMVGFFAVYVCTAPIGATLMKYTLLRRRKMIVWSLSGIALWQLFSHMGA